jgi:type 1 glutamine amidotransferase
MTRALVFSGGADYSDPWHPYVETSEHLAEVLRAGDMDVQVAERVDVALNGLEDHPDLLAVNAGAGPHPQPRDDELAAAVLAHVHRGGGLLVLHLSTGLFPLSPRWEALTGARWIWDVSGHPPQGSFRVDVSHEEDLTAGIEDFDIVDESYADLRLGAGSRMLASHVLDGVRHPLVWLRQSGAGRIAVDLLGHDAASFAPREHRELLGRVARWAAS